MVEVSDDGKGFDAQRAPPFTHGLAGMRHRVEAARGKLDVASTPGKGTRPERHRCRPARPDAGGPAAPARRRLSVLSYAPRPLLLTGSSRGHAA